MLNTRIMSGIDKIKPVERLQLLLMTAFTATLLLGQPLNSLLFVLMVASFLLTWKYSSLLAYEGSLWVFAGGFVLTLISSLWTTNVYEGKLVVERQLALFLMPLLYLPSSRNEHVKIALVLKVLFISTLVVSVYLLKCSAEKFIAEHQTVKEWASRDNLNHGFSKPIGMHATYLSLFVAMSVIIGFNWLRLNHKLWIKLAVFVCILILVLTLTLLSSRMVIMSLVIVLCFIYPFFVSGLKGRPWLLVAGASIVLVGYFIIRQTTFVADRFSDKLEDEFRMTPFLKADSTYNPVYGGETRADRWYCAMELFREKPLLGYGVGSEKDMLMVKYRKYNLQNAEVNKYDAHNQYLAFAIKSGIFGVAIFVWSIVYSVILAIRRRSFLYLGFIVLFSITCMTENVLESNKGIFFYAFLNTLFAVFCLRYGNGLSGSEQENGIGHVIES